MKKTVYIESLGCAKNQVDSEKMAALLEKSGYIVVNDSLEADCIIVNTCGFIQSAKEEAIETIFEAVRLKSEGKCRKVIVAGCLAQRYPQVLEKEFSSDEVDAIFGVGDLSKIVEVLEKGQRVVLIPERVEDSLMDRKVIGFPGSAYLRVSDGCSNHCAYCTIPVIRGELYSRKKEDILREFEGLLPDTLKEINIISQDTTNYGLDLYGKRALLSLMKELDKQMKDGQWMRVLYLHPDHICNNFLDGLEKLTHFVPYFDIPFQSASETILTRMGRSGSKEKYRKLIHDIRERFPQAVIRSTFIVGFPGERKEDVELTCDFIQEAGIEWVGTFIYSDEEGTESWKYPEKVPLETAKRWNHKVIRTAEKTSAICLERFVGKEEKVLIEERIDDDLCLGRFWGQAPEVDGVTVVDSSKAKPGDFLDVKVMKLNGKDFFAVEC